MALHNLNDTLSNFKDTYQNDPLLPLMVYCDLMFLLVENETFSCVFACAFYDGGVVQSMVHEQQHIHFCGLAKNWKK